MVKAQVSRGQVLIDPFTGQSLSREDLVERLAPFQQGVPEPLQADDLPLGLFLQPAAPRDIIARMLRNLKELHRSHEDWQRLIAVLDRMVILLPTEWQELRDRGLAHAACGHHALALQDLQAYLAHAGDAADAPEVEERVRSLRKI
jgi:regulator of sirC expression with transglutaminase-like and TPR domain